MFPWSFPISNLGLQFLQEQHQKRLHLLKSHYFRLEMLLWFQSSGFLGFQFTEGDGSDHFGWMRVTLTNNGQGLIHEWAYNDTAGEAIQVGAIIPEPSSLLLIGAGSLGLLIRRSRQR